MGESTVSSVRASLFLLKEFTFYCLEVVAEALSLLLIATASTVTTTTLATSTGFSVVASRSTTTSSLIELLAVVLLVTSRVKLILLVRLRLRLIVVIILRHSIVHRSASSHDRALIRRKGFVHFISIHLLA